MFMVNKDYHIQSNLRDPAFGMTVN